MASVLTVADEQEVLITKSLACLIDFLIVVKLLKNNFIRNN